MLGSGEQSSALGNGSSVPQRQILCSRADLRRRCAIARFFVLDQLLAAGVGGSMGAFEGPHTRVLLFFVTQKGPLSSSSLVNSSMTSKVHENADAELKAETQRLVIYPDTLINTNKAREAGRGAHFIG